MLLQLSIYMHACMHAFLLTFVIVIAFIIITGNLLQSCIVFRHAFSWCYRAPTSRRKEPLRETRSPV